jgi:hypothetical protein
MIQNYSPAYGTDFRHGSMIQSPQNPLSDPLPQLYNLLMGEFGQ